MPVDLRGHGFEGVVHLAVFANAVDVVERGEQGRQHIDDAVLTEAILFLLARLRLMNSARSRCNASR